MHFDAVDSFDEPEHRAPELLSTRRAASAATIAQMRGARWAKSFALAKLQDLLNFFFFEQGWFFLLLLGICVGLVG